MSSTDHAVHNAERLVGGLLTVGMATIGASMRRASQETSKDVAVAAYLGRVDANARAAVRAKTAATLSGTAALIAAYNRNRVTARG